MRDRFILRGRTLRSRMPRVALLGAGAMVLAGCGSDAGQSALRPAGPFAQAPHDLIIPVAIIALAVFILVQGLIVYTSWRYRAKGDDEFPKQVHGNTKLEILWTIIPALILAVIAVPTVRGIFEMAGEPAEEFLTVEVIGHRWWFEYYYPDQDIYTANELVIPAGVPVRLQMTATDPARQTSQAVIHSFWVPQLAGKQDLEPGRTTHLNIQADEPGRFLGMCAEYCGLSHANMRIRVIAKSDADYAAWLESQTTPAAEPEEGSLAARGRELFGDLGDRQACASCHQVWNGGSRGPSTGPDLTHLFSRTEFAGAIHDLTEENLREWLRDPEAMKAMSYEVNGIGMPNLNLTNDEIDALVAYLLTLR
ncbi:MAG: cytochrome c oxidase subunit II [Nitriliruptoraceae bacterium]